MILAAGFGTRLKPLTDTLPKALIPHRSSPMITHQIERLKKAGISEIVVNIHHFPEKMITFFEENDFGIKIDLSMEEGEILGTGGGILNAEKFLKDEEYFTVMNVDIDTNFDIQNLIDFTLNEKPFAALAVQKRNTQRGLTFDANMKMTGIQNKDSKPDEVYGFNCMHVISSEIFRQGYEVKFSGIFDLYRDLITRGSVILGYDTGECYFKDLGKIEHLQS